MNTETKEPINNKVPPGTYHGTIVEVRSTGFCTNREAFLIKARIPESELLGTNIEPGDHDVWMRWPTAAPNGAYRYGLDRVMELTKEAKLALTGQSQDKVRAIVHSSVTALGLTNTPVEVVVKAGQPDERGGRYPNEVSLFPAENVQITEEEAMEMILKSKKAEVTENDDEEEEPADD